MSGDTRTAGELIEVTVDHATFERILAAAVRTGRILAHSQPHADVGLTSLIVWPTIDGNNPIVLVAGES